MLAVTTRNKLRSWRYSLPMMRARGYVREQLAATPGLIRYVSAIASPTEFLTMTVWENRQAMFDFMSSGAHQEFMWMFSRWSASFWSMRWIPTTAEEGAWDGQSLASMLKPEDQAWRAALPLAPQLPLQEQRPARMPGGRSLDPSGCDVYAVTALVKSANPGHIWSLLRTIRQFRRGSDHPELLRWNIGVVDAQRIWVLTLWRATSEGPSGALNALRPYVHPSWTMCWTAGEYEIGHWDRLRLRQQASKRSRQHPGTSEPVGSDLS